MPRDDQVHSLNPACAQRFGELDARNIALDRTLKTMKRCLDDARVERRQDHKELVGKLDEFILDHEKRVTTVEESAKSAHHRVDAIKSILQWAGGLLITGGLVVVGWLVAK